MLNKHCQVHVCLAYCLKCKSTSRHFQPGDDPSRGLLHDCEIFANLRLTFVSSSSECCSNEYFRHFLMLFLIRSDHFLTVGSLQGIDIREEVGQNFTWLKSSTRCGLTMKNVGLLSAGTWRCHLGMG